jgi:hypothetical protein
MRPVIGRSLCGVTDAAHAVADPAIFPAVTPTLASPYLPADASARRFAISLR